MTISLTHAEKVLHQGFVWLHLFKVKHEWTEILEGCHFDPFIRVFAKLVEKLYELAIFGLFTA